MTRYLIGTGLTLLLLASTGYAEENSQSLFNGKDLEGWDGDPDLWAVEDGAIVGRLTAETPLEHNTFLIWKGGEPSNFRLRLECRIEGEGGNSGIQYRSRVIDPEKWIVGGYQADFVVGPQYTGILYEERGRGILANRGERVRIDPDGNRQVETFADAAELQEHVRDGDWNEYLIEAIGPRLRHTINGQRMSVTIDRDRQHRARSGVIAFQLHRGPPMTVRFRNIELEKIEPRERQRAN